MMENILRLLNPKTTNFDSIGGGSYGALTAQDVLLAMSYANLSPLQDNLIRLKCLGANNAQNISRFSKALTSRYEHKIIDYASNHVLTVINVALVEFCAVTANYKPSARNRALIAGVNHLVIHRYLNQAIDMVLLDLNAEFDVASENILFHIKKTN